MSNKKKWLIGTALIALTSVSVFAAGVPEGDGDSDSRPGRNSAAVPGEANGDADSSVNPRFGRIPAANRGEGRLVGEDLEFDTYEGTFSMVEGRYPALVTPKGETFYLMPHFPLTADQIPEDGAKISVRTLPCPISPVHLEVFEAEINGEELIPDWEAFRGGPGMGGPGMGGPGGFVGRPDAGGPYPITPPCPYSYPYGRRHSGMRGGEDWYDGYGMHGGPARFGDPSESEWRRPRPMWGSPIPEEPSASETE